MGWETVVQRAERATSTVQRVVPITSLFVPAGTRGTLAGLGGLGPGPGSHLVDDARVYAVARCIQPTTRLCRRSAQTTGMRIERMLKESEEQGVFATDRMLHTAT